MRQGLLLIVVLALLPVVIAGFIQGFSAFQNTRDLATQRLGANASAVAERQRDPFVIAQHILLALATNADVRDMSSRCVGALKSALSPNSPVSNLARTAADGSVRCSAMPHNGTVNFANEAWWQRAVDANGMTITRTPVFGSILQRNVLVLFLPIRENADDVGTLSAAIDVAYLRAALRTAPEGRSGSLAIVTRDRMVVAEGRTALAFQPQIEGPQGRPRQATARDGTSWYYTFHKLYGTELFVVYGEPQRQLMSVAVSQVRASILLPLLSILMASLAIWLGTNRLALVWLQELRTVAGSFAKGDFTGDKGRFEKAPEEIATLSADLHSMAEVIDRRNQDLTQALEVKGVLTREVHHRVKNNLQIINSLLTLQSGRVPDGEAKEVLAQTRARISALALIHRLLYEQDNGYERGEVAIDTLLQELCIQLQATIAGTSGITLHCHAASIPLPVDYAVPLTLFIVEAVTNAFRHAFPDGGGGLINLSLTIDGSEAALSVTDNGRGYLVNDDTAQMGTELMYGFATQVGGRLSIASTVGEGARVNLTFPVRHAA